MPWTGETMEPVIRAWDARVRRDLSRFARLVPEAAARGSVLRDGASDAALDALEQRLGRRLPPSYRAFLALSDGADASGIGAVDAATNARHGFLPAGEVAPLAEVYPLLIEVWTAVPAAPGPGSLADQGAEVRNFAPIRDAVVISGWADALVDLLVPRPGREEWLFWAMSKEGATRYPSFGDFLMFQVNRPDDRPRADLADVYVAGVRSGRLHMLAQLAEIADPRAGELACRALVDPAVPEGVRHHAVMALKRLDDPAHTECLQRAFAAASDASLRSMIVWALHARGDHTLDTAPEHGGER
jgi:hypothetical protein